MASIIFFAPRDLGEAVLCSGAVGRALREPSDTLTIVAAPEISVLFRAAPAKIRAPKQRAFAFAASLLFRTPCDMLIDALGGFPGRIAPARRRIRLQPAQTVRHLTEDWAEALGEDKALAPMLWLDDAARAAAAGIVPDAGQLLVLAPGGVSESKRWPRERFAAVARRLAGGPLTNAKIIVLGAAARDAETTRAIVSSLDADGLPARDLGQGLDLLAAAALMERATLCIGNDNALTHIAAAMGAPTLTLFGPTDERVRAPFGPRARTLRGKAFEEVARNKDQAAMDEISIDAVEAAALETLHAGGLR